MAKEIKILNYEETYNPGMRATVLGYLEVVRKANEEKNSSVEFWRMVYEMDNLTKNLWESTFAKTDNKIIALARPENNIVMLELDYKQNLPSLVVLDVVLKYSVILADTVGDYVYER